MTTKKIAPTFLRGVFFDLLLHDVRQHRHKARALDGCCELALVPGADAGAFAGDDLSEGGKVALESLCIFVVDGVDVGAAERALTFRVFLDRHSS